MIHPDTILKPVHPLIGVGVFATASIPAGTMTYVEDDLELHFRRDDPRLEDPRYRDPILKFSTVEADGRYSMSWDIAKYMNHCCHYNTLSTGYGFEIAVRDIAAGEQLTDDYGVFNLEEPMQLSCHYPDCRGHVRQDDYDRMTPQWDADIQRALGRFQAVPQPLYGFLDEGVQADLNRYLESGEGYRSITILRRSGAGGTSV
ncbi:MAG TPA: SET domain-containing protein [Anaerolineales bacterium]|nr:SET domain-containing protein [Anaerolineales bacterium]